MDSRTPPSIPPLAKGGIEGGRIGIVPGKNMPNEILNIQHTIIQLQNIEKLQAVGQQREQYQHKAEAMHQQTEKELEQTVVQISEEAEKVFLQDERQEERDHGKEKKHVMYDDEEEIKDEENKIKLDIIV